MIDLAGKVAVITGAASGIGKATAEIMAKAGARVVIGDFDKEGAEDVARGIEAAGGEAVAVAFDAMSEASIKNLIDKAAARFGTIHILHNNVGGGEPALDRDVLTMDVDAWDRAFHRCLRSMMLACKFTLPLMIKSGGGAIVNTGSMAGMAGDSGHTGYGAAKSGVHALTQYIASQYGKQNIRCNAVAPGLIVTPKTRGLFSDEVLGVFERHNLVPRVGAPEDIGYVVAFLASDLAGYLTGQTICVDGGAFAHTPTLADLFRVMGEGHG